MWNQLYLTIMWNQLFSTNMWNQLFSTRMWNQLFSTRIWNQLFLTKMWNQLFSTNMWNQLFSTNMWNQLYLTKMCDLYSSLSIELFWYIGPLYTYLEIVSQSPGSSSLLSSNSFSFSLPAFLATCCKKLGKSWWLRVWTLNWEITSETSYPLHTYYMLPCIAYLNFDDLGFKVVHDHSNIFSSIWCVCVLVTAISEIVCSCTVSSRGIQIQNRFIKLFIHIYVLFLLVFALKKLTKTSLFRSVFCNSRISFFLWFQQNNCDI